MSTIDVRTLRKDLKLTRRQVAEWVGVDLSTISRWEDGKTVPRRSAQKLLEQLASNKPSRRKQKAATA